MEGVVVAGEWDCLVLVCCNPRVTTHCVYCGHMLCKQRKASPALSAAIAGEPYSSCKFFKTAKAADAVLKLPSYPALAGTCFSTAQCGLRLIAALREAFALIPMTGCHKRSGHQEVVSNPGNPTTAYPTPCRARMRKHSRDYSFNGASSCYRVSSTPHLG